MKPKDMIETQWTAELNLCKSNPTRRHFNITITIPTSIIKAVATAHVVTCNNVPQFNALTLLPVAVYWLHESF